MNHPTDPMTPVRVLIEAAGKAHQLPWKVYIQKTAHYLGGFHIELFIGTQDDDAQLKGPFPVVGMGFGLGKAEGDPVVPLLGLRERRGFHCCCVCRHRFHLPTAIRA